jgi:hypothetical protein
MVKLPFVSRYVSLLDFIPTAVWLIVCYLARYFQVTFIEAMSLCIASATPLRVVISVQNFNAELYSAVMLSISSCTMRGSLELPL